MNSFSKVASEGMEYLCTGKHFKEINTPLYITRGTILSAFFEMQLR